MQIKYMGLFLHPHTWSSIPAALPSIQRCRVGWINGRKSRQSSATGRYFRTVSSIAPHPESGRKLLRFDCTCLTFSSGFTLFFCFCYPMRLHATSPSQCGETGTCQGLWNSTGAQSGLLGPHHKRKPCPNEEFAIGTEIRGRILGSSLSLRLLNIA